MAPFECDNILYRRDHNLTDDEYNVNSIAEAVINWGISTAFDDIDQYYHFETFAYLNVITTTVIDSLNVFEFEFEQIFSKHCNENMSEEQFVSFVGTGCYLLGKINGYFGYIMPCVFMRETMFRFKNNFNCSHFFILAQECLAKFLEKKFKEFEKDKSWKGFLSYCKDINAQFCEKVHFQILVCEHPSDEELCIEHLNVIKNSDPINKSSDGRDAAECLTGDDRASTIRSPVASDFAWTNSTNMSEHTNNGNYTLNKIPDSSFVSNTKTDYIMDLTKAVSDICFEDENEPYGETEENYFKNYVCSSDISPDTASNGTDIIKGTDGTFVLKTKSDKTVYLTKAITKICSEHENESFKSEENFSADCVCSCDISSVTSSTSTDSSEEEYIVMCNILMPDDEFAEEVFKCLGDCFDFFDKSDNVGNRAKLDENYGFSFDNIDEYSENKFTFSILPKSKNGNIEMPACEDFIGSSNDLTIEPYTQRYCVRCNR